MFKYDLKININLQILKNIKNWKKAHCLCQQYINYQLKLQLHYHNYHHQDYHHQHHYHQHHFIIIKYNINCNSVNVNVNYSLVEMTGGKQNLETVVATSSSASLSLNTTATPMYLCNINQFVIFVAQILAAITAKYIKMWLIHHLM